MAVCWSKKKIKLFRAVLDRFPGCQHADDGEEAGKHDQPHREAIDAEVMVPDSGAGDPGVIFNELEALSGRYAKCAGRCSVSAKVTSETSSVHQRDDAPVARQQRHDERACSRHEGHQRQYVVSQHEYVPGSFLSRCECKKRVVIVNGESKVDGDE